MFVHRRCAELIEQIPSAQHDPNKPEDVLKFDANQEDGSGGDDDLDSLRMLCASNPSLTIYFAKPLKVGGYQAIGF